jgi:hypothetical protein
MHHRFAKQHRSFDAIQLYDHCQCYLLISSVNSDRFMKVLFYRSFAFR